MSEQAASAAQVRLLQDREPIAIDGLAVAREFVPRDAGELGEYLRAAAAERLHVVPSGTGARLGIGNRPDGVDALVSTRALDRVLAHEAADMTVTVEAGARLDAVQETLARSGQFLPFDPPGDGGTIGGLLASGVAGPLRHRFGTARDWVLGTRVAHADGASSRSGGRVVKNVSGYDMHKLYVGSLGTLAVIGEVTLKVAPLPRVDETLAVACPTAGAAGAVIAACHERGLSLAAAELLSPAAAEAVVGRGSWCALLRVAGGAAAATRTLRDIGEFAVLAEGEAAAAGEAWGAWRRAYAPDGLLLRISVLPSQATAVVETLDRRYAGEGVALSATVSAGIVRARLRPADEARGGRLIEDARSYVAARGGHVFVEAAPAAVKAQIDVFGPARGDVRIMRRLKEAFDPGRVLSPGRFAGRL